MKRFAYIFIITLCLGLHASAQEAPSVQQSRRMNSRLLDLLDKYEKYSSFEDANFTTAFKSLFLSDYSTVLCDFPTCLSFGKEIPVIEYIKFTDDLDQSGIVQTLYDVRRTDYRKQGGNWTVDLAFTRQISYTDKLNMSFESVHDLVLSCVYDTASDRFMIESVSGINQDELRSRPWFTLPGQPFYIVRNTSHHDSKLLSGKEKLNFDGDYAYVTNGNFKVKDDDLLLRKVDEGSTSAYTMLSFKYKPMRWRARVHGDFALNGGYNIRLRDRNISKFALSYGAGAEIGYMIGMGSVFKFGLYTGAGVDIGNLILSSKGVSYDFTYSNPADVSQKITRHYDIQSANESITLYSAYIPVYFATEYKLTQWLYLTADAGPRFYINTKAMTPYSVKYSVDEGPVQSVSFNNYLLPVTIAPASFDFSLYGRLGLDFAYRRHILGLRLGFEYGLMDILQRQRDAFYSDAWFDDSTVEKCYPIIYDEAHGDVAAYSLSAFVEYNRMAVWLEVGYKFKF